LAASVDLGEGRWHWLTWLFCILQSMTTSLRQILSFNWHYTTTTYGAKETPVLPLPIVVTNFYKCCFYCFTKKRIFSVSHRF